MSKSKFDGTEETVVKVVLGALFVFSAASSIFNWLDADAQVPVIFLALLLVIRLVEPVHEIHQDVRYLREVNSSAVVKPYPTLNAFYSDLVHAMNTAQHTLDLTHIRDQPPADFGVSPSKYFDSLLDWVRGDESRSVRRLISVRNQAMMDWAVELLRCCSSEPRFEVRVVHWTMDAPAINMAIVDGEAVFLALTGDSLQRTGGLGVEDHDIAKYFLDYYSNLWRCATPLAEFMTRETARS